METPPTPLDSQVGGHAGVLTIEDGSLLIKPALPRELEFYQALQQDAALEDLRMFTPVFIGTLKLEGKVDPANPDLTSGVPLQPVDAEQKESIVLENLSHSFLKPNILDIKLGTVLYDETASPEKVARMEKTARDTTSFETGVRLTGFQVYDNVSGLPVNTPKSYGKSIKAHELGEGIAKFFPIAVTPPSNEPANTLIPSLGLPRESLIPILQGIREEIANIRETFAAVEIRMVGGSLLILYEADWARAEEGIEKCLAEDADGEEEEGEEEEEEGEGDEGEDDNGVKPLGPPFVVKLIDFAHTKLVPGEGPDEGVLRGMDTVLRLLDSRLEEITIS